MLSCIITYYNLLALRVSVNAHRLFLQIADFKHNFVCVSRIRDNLYQLNLYAWSVGA